MGEAVRRESQEVVIRCSAAPPACPGLKHCSRHPKRLYPFPAISMKGVAFRCAKTIAAILCNIIFNDIHQFAPMSRVFCSGGRGETRCIYRAYLSGASRAPAVSEPETRFRPRLQGVDALHLK